MPECYEVKRMASYMKDNGVLNSPIIDFSFCNKGNRLLKSWTTNDFVERVLKQRIHDIKTKSKFTFLQLDDDVLEWHYRFTGIPHIDNAVYTDRLYSIYTLPITPKNPKNSTRFILKTKNGTCLRYVDTRCLSTLTLYKDIRIEQTHRFKTLAPDISEAQFLVNSEIKKHSKKRLKLFLQDQFTTPSGIGNYLACEICAYANIYPNIQLHLLTNNHIQALNMALKQVHLYAMKSPKYDWFLVFNQEFCQSCFAPVIRQKFKSNEQTTHWCKCCQL